MLCFRLRVSWAQKVHRTWLQAPQGVQVRSTCLSFFWGRLTTRHVFLVTTSEAREGKPGHVSTFPAPALLTSANIALAKASRVAKFKVNGKGSELHPPAGRDAAIKYGTEGWGPGVIYHSLFISGLFSLTDGDSLTSASALMEEEPKSKTQCILLHLQVLTLNSIPIY